MSEEQITILKDVKCQGKNNCLYYYRGNFFYPIMVDNGDLGRVRKAIRVFTKENKALVEKDRADPKYKTKLELFDEQMEKYGDQS
jgi:hypothetical protein